MSEDTYSPAEVLAMDQHEIGKHMSGGYGPAKALKLYRALRLHAVEAKNRMDACEAVYNHMLDKTTDIGQHS